MNGKYKRGKKIESVSDFEKSHSLWFRVIFGTNERTKHRGFLMSWQYHTLELFIRRGYVYEAELIQNDQMEEKNAVHLQR